MTKVKRIQQQQPQKERPEKNHECGNLMSFCFSIHILSCSVFCPSAHILKKTDNSVATIDDFCVEIDLLDSELGCGVTFKLNLIGRPTQDTSCSVVRECERRLISNCRYATEEKDRMIDISAGTKCLAAQTIDLEKIQKKIETKIRSTWQQHKEAPDFDGDFAELSKF